MIKIMPYTFKKDGRFVHAACYPYVNGTPAPSIAHCLFCSLYNPDENEICFGWKAQSLNAPLFCGPVCPKFDLLPSMQKILEVELEEKAV